MNDITLPRDVAEQVLTALEKLRDGLLKMREHAESYGHSWAIAYVKEYREMLPGAAEQQFRALNVMENRLADVAEGVAQGFDAITALRDRLAQPEQEPDYWLGFGLQAHTKRPFEGATPLYTSPPQREWVDLTDEEIDEWAPEIHLVIRLIEAKLKEKNT